MTPWRKKNRKISKALTMKHSELQANVAGVINLGYAVLASGVIDAKGFARAGLYSKEGDCLVWPLKKSGKERRNIMSCKDPTLHIATKHFFLGGEYEEWADAVGFNSDGQTVWSNILKAVPGAGEDEQWVAPRPRWRCK